MKKYDHQTRKWINSEEYDKKYTPRPKNICRGRKPHDYVLVLPSYITYNSSYKFNPEIYYRLMDEKYEYLESLKNKIKSLGIVDRFGWNRKETRHYVCSVCKKQNYEFVE